MCQEHDCAFFKALLSISFILVLRTIEPIEPEKYLSLPPCFFLSVFGQFLDTARRGESIDRFKRSISYCASTFRRWRKYHTLAMWSINRFKGSLITAFASNTVFFAHAKCALCHSERKFFTFEVVVPWKFRSKIVTWCVASNAVFFAHASKARALSLTFVSPNESSTTFEVVVR